MCILSFLLGRRSRFIFWMRALRSEEAMMILCMAAVSFVVGWIWRLYHATVDGRLINYPVHLSSFSHAAIQRPACLFGTPTSRG
jgi:hypothetical protein